jgi:hypothetical protein
LVQFDGVFYSPGETGVTIVLFSGTKWEDIQFARAAALLDPAFDELDRSQVAVGHPLVLDLEQYADEWEVSLDRDARSKLKRRRFFIVRFALLIRPTQAIRVTGLDVKVRLDSPGNRANVWSMDPVAVDDQMEVMVASRVRGDLTLESARVDLKNPTKEESTVRVPRIHAYGLGADWHGERGQVPVGWLFRPDHGAILSGMQVLTMVVDLARDAPCGGEVTVKAQLGGFGAPRPDVDRKTYALGSGTKRIAFDVAS